MIIKSIHIDSFGAIEDTDYELSGGLNIIAGANESGKSTLATFIKFMLYGLSGRKTEGEISDRSRYASWNTGRASGSMTVSCKGREYRIEREYYAFADINGGDTSRDRCTVTDLYSGERVFKNEIPGAALLGIPEQLFVNTVFVKQLDGSKIDGNGMAEAIENLLMSGDEGVSTKKAVERLEKERVSLLHKNGGGGLISELQREAVRLKQKMREAAKQNSDVIELESTVEELEGTVKTRENESEYYSAIIEARDKITEKQRRDEAREYAAKIEEIDSRLDELSAYGNIGEKVLEITELTNAVKASEEKQKILRRREMELDRELPPLMSKAEIDDSRDSLFEAARRRSKRKGLIAWGIILFLIGAGVVASDILLNPPYHLIFLGCAAFFILLGAILFTAGLVNSSKYKRILREWNVSSVEEFDRTLSRRIELSDRRTDPRSDYSVTVAALRDAESDRLALTDKLRTKALAFTSPSDNIEEMAQRAVEEANRIAGETEELLKLRNETYGKYSVLESAFGDFDDEEISEKDREATALLETELGATAANLSREEEINCRKKKKFAETALPSLRAQLAEKSNRLSVMRATASDPMALSAQLESLEKQLNEAQHRYEGITLAVETLTAAGDSIRRGILPRIKEEAQRLLGNFTDGRYTDLGIDRSFDMNFRVDGKTRDAAFFSAGTKDVAYIALRMALTRVLFSGDVPPMIYDESFARVDESRLRRVLRLLDSAGDDGVQSLLFTCRTLEEELSSDLESVNVINL